MVVNLCLYQYIFLYLGCIKLALEHVLYKKKIIKNRQKYIKTLTLTYIKKTDYLILTNWTLL